MDCNRNSHIKKSSINVERKFFIRKILPIIFKQNGQFLMRYPYPSSHVCNLSIVCVFMRPVTFNRQTKSFIACLSIFYAREYPNSDHLLGQCWHFVGSIVGNDVSPAFFLVIGPTYVLIVGLTLVQCVVISMVIEILLIPNDVEEK